MCTKYDPVSSTNKADRHDIAEILLKVALSAINKQTNTKHFQQYFSYIVAVSFIGGGNRIIFCAHTI
jgi:hypothetical protein